MLSKKAGAGLTTKLIDFGLVKNVGQTSGHSRTGIVLGTPMYMSPEQITATGVDDRADIYAIGLTMYFALTGKRPYPKRGLSSLIHAHLSEELPNLQDSNPSIPATHMINWIIKSAVAKDVQNRFQNTLQMLETLEICERFMDRDSFPIIELNKGVLTSLSDGVIIDPELPQSPLVQSGSYVDDGSAISEDFAQTIGLKVEDHMPTVGFESSSALGPHTLAHQQSSVVPASMEPTETRSVKEPETNSVSPLMKAIGVFFLVAIVVGGYVVLSNPSTKPTNSTPASGQSTSTAVEHEVSLDSVPSGADIFIDDQFAGSTPTVVKAKNGKSKKVRISLDGYEDREFILSEDTHDEMVVQLKESVVVPERTTPKKSTLKSKPVKRNSAKSPPKPNVKAKETVKKVKVQEPKPAKPKKKGELKETEWD
jgi:serine/threonine protein kinase